jgi:thiol-disulfide isomerase/thioredoxin
MVFILRFFLTIICFSLSLFGSASPAVKYFSDNKISIGIWHGEILREDGQKIPFNFQIRETGGRMVIYIINGAERLLVDNIRQEGDSFFIVMPFFDSYFALRIVNDQKLEGSWIKNYGDHSISTAFQATFNEIRRYPEPLKPAFNISGRWSAHFKSPTDSTEAIGEFRQSGSEVRGTFLTTTGDYRFLEGQVSGDTLMLSTFDGGHAYSFKSKIVDSNKMQDGYFFAGAKNIENWVAEKNENAKLPDEYSLTRLKDSTNKILHFRFPDLNEHKVSLSDPEFKNKVVVVQILGSWCPNCMDETRFLSSYYLKNKTRGVEIVGLAYERTTSYSSTVKLLQPFISRFHVTYPILATGVSVNDTLRTEKSLPELQEIVGFPTTIFIDKKGMVRKIHTGFDGPGTGDHYEIFQKEFDDLISSLLKE